MEWRRLVSDMIIQYIRCQIVVLWIRILTDPFIRLFLIRTRIWNGDSDPGAWKLIKNNKWTWFPDFQKVFCTFVGMFLTYHLSKYIFHVEIKLFVTLKSDQDPDPHGNALVWLPGSGSALKLIRIHNTAKQWIILFIGSDISTGRFSRRGRNWMRAWAWEPAELDSPASYCVSFPKYLESGVRTENTNLDYITVLVLMYVCINNREWFVLVLCTYVFLQFFPKFKICVGYET